MKIEKIEETVVWIRSALALRVAAVWAVSKFQHKLILTVRAKVVYQNVVANRIHSKSFVSAEKINDVS